MGSAGDLAYLPEGVVAPAAAHARLAELAAGLSVSVVSELGA